MESVTIKRLSLEEITESCLLKLKKVFERAYYNSNMYEALQKDIAKRPEVFQGFVACHGMEIVGCVFLVKKPRDSKIHYNFEPLCLKRFTVLPEFRSLEIGKKLLDKAKKYAFEEQKVPVIFVSSNEAGALSFYGREGALYSTGSVENYSARNFPTENLCFFKEFISNPKFKNYRYPIGKGIALVFCNSEVETKFFEIRGFVSKKFMLSCN
jgi:ribosomal protein S18 acetylase RimI-like enzyme